MEMAKVTSRGQITIPVSIRRRLEIDEGDKLLFIDTADGVLMVNPDKIAGAPPKSTPVKIAVPKRPAPVVATPITKPSDDEVSSDVTSSDTVIADTDGAGADSDFQTIEAPQPVDVPQAIEAPEEFTESVEKPTSNQTHGLDLHALLDEIRNIGSSSNK